MKRLTIKAPKDSAGLPQGQAWYYYLTGEILSETEEVVRVKRPDGIVEEVEKKHIEKIEEIEK